MEKVNIMGINISLLSREEILKRVDSFLETGKGHYLVTPNPEIILKATKPGFKDEELFYILNKADMAVADGTGVKLAGYLMGVNIPRFTGADLTPILLEKAEKKNIRVGIVKPVNSLASEEEITKTLKKEFPSLKFIIKSVKSEEEVNIPGMSEFAPEMLVVTLGAPAQEKIISRALHRYDSTRLAAGVGGSLDFLSGKIKRAPRLLRGMGLEWLWRLAKEPWRIKRIWRAVAIFPYYFLRWKLVLPFLYRRNVACFLYKKEKARYKIFIVERRGQKGHWQIPQGGREGRESIERTGMRELKEELNCDGIIPRKAYKIGEKYLFPGKHKKRGGYKGQKQDLFIAEFTGENKDVQINFWDHRNWKWVDSRELIRYIHPIRREKTKKFLKQFYKYFEESNQF